MIAARVTPERNHGRRVLLVDRQRGRHGAGPAAGAGGAVVNACGMFCTNRTNIVLIDPTDKENPRWHMPICPDCLAAMDRIAKDADARGIPAHPLQ